MTRNEGKRERLRQILAEALLRQRHDGATCPSNHCLADARAAADAVLDEIWHELDERLYEVAQINIAAKDRALMEISRQCARAHERADQAEAEIARLQELMERMPDVHIQLKVLGETGPVTCADWCPACRTKQLTDELNELRALVRQLSADNESMNRYRAYMDRIPTPWRRP